MARLTKKFSEPSLTKQSFKKECSLSFIMDRYTKTGQIPQSRRPVRFGVSEGDFQEVQFALARANSSFETLPDHIRDKYGSVNGVISALNDPDLASELESDGVLQAYGIEGMLETADLSTALPADSEPDGEGGEAPSDEGASP